MCMITSYMPKIIIKSIMRINIYLEINFKYIFAQSNIYNHCANTLIIIKKIY